VYDSGHAGRLPPWPPGAFLPAVRRLPAVSEPGDPPICSAKGCRAPAAYQLRWNNPRLHAPERRKVWLACAEHRVRLADFLDARGFLREVAPWR
jgi:hypothetical protein